ncbi:MAG TPA: hypothetical protein VJ958_02620 [Atribacterota bacterium]|nr:hypothetical protein [Atribacterota bacterium]
MEKMDIIKVVIENWPKSNYLFEYIPIIIAIIALGLSLYSIFITRKSFIDSNRPYVWASNYKSNALAPLHVSFYAMNSPARIIKMQLKITSNSESLSSLEEKNFLVFPKEMYSIIFKMSYDDFDKICEKSYKEKSELNRIISFDYSSLNFGRIYHYILEQKYDFQKHDWENISENSD